MIPGSPSPHRLPRRAILKAAALGLLAYLAAAPALAAPVTLGRLAEPDGPRPESELKSRAADSLQALEAGGLSGLLAGPVDPAVYVMGPGDVLSLEKGAPAGTVQTLVVDVEGYLPIPDLGLRKVAGLTLAEARRGILADLKRFLPRATVELRLIRPRSFKVFLVGETNNPGTVAATAANRAVEALTERGALLKTSSLRNITLLRNSGASERVDLQSFLVLGDQSHNPWLADGDRIVIRPLRDQIYVSGAIQRGGYFELAPGDSLGTILRLAGGLAEGARSDSILVQRFHGASETDSMWLSAERGASTPLSADDRIFVRRQSPWRPLALVSAEGELRLPGEYAIREGVDRVSDLVRWAGGFTAAASPDNAVLLRDTERSLMDDPDLDRLRRLTRAEMTETEYQDLKMRTEGRTTSYQVDLTAISAPGARENVFLRSGDRLVVSASGRTVRVSGEVQRPGLFGYRPGMSARDYVDLAGGFGPRADKSETRVIRSSDGQSLTAKDVDHISAGDYVWVPEKSAGTGGWTVFKDIIAVTAQVATIILVITSNRSSSTTK